MNWKRQSSEVQFERRYGENWVTVSPPVEALASASLDVSVADWLADLEFTPRKVREYLTGFLFTRMEALQVIAWCPHYCRHSSRHRR